MSVNIGALRAELQNDPDNLGYPQFAPTWTDNQVGLAMSLLNTRVPAYRTRGSQIARQDFLGAIDIRDLKATTSAGRQYLTLLTSDATIMNTNQMRGSLQDSQDGLSNSFGSRSRIAALFAQVNASRGENLFGRGVRVQSQHIYKAIQ